MQRSLPFLALVVWGVLAMGEQSTVAIAAPNILFITVDDMSCDSVGAFGCKLPETTPQIDRLAAEGRKFAHAHVVVGNCMPSRNVMYSGLYPHSNGVEGFRPVPDARWPHLVDLFKAGGYFTAIRHKVSHSTPYTPYGWDLVLDELQGRPSPKDPASYGESVRLGIERSRQSQKPFCLIINVGDPHKPFYAMGAGDRGADDPYVPTRVFTAEEVPVPGFLFEHPEVRRELAHYYSSVRRADDCVGAALKALDEAGVAEDTVVFFLSDHGMPLPFAKTALYYHSTHTPLIIRWPGVTQPGSVDEEHLVSAVDLLSTLCEIVGIAPPERQDGRSFLPLIRGERQSDRDYLFTEYNENSGRMRQPMRGVVTTRFGYIFNPWSDGKRQVRTATQGTITYRTMKQVALTDREVAARLELFDHRVVEEFYDYAADPDALVNLIDDPRYQEDLRRLRTELENHLRRTADPALEAFLRRDDRAFLAEFMRQQEMQVQEEARPRPAAGRGAQNSPSASRQTPVPPNPQPRRAEQLISLVVPEVVRAGESVNIQVRHQLPAILGNQALHVTLKQGREERRVERKVVTVSGMGTAMIEFKVPQRPVDGVVSFAAFVGNDFPSALQHITTKPAAVTE